MPRTITVKELRAKLPKIMEKISYKTGHFIITKRGRPVSVLMSIKEFEGIIETIEIMSDEKAMKTIRLAQKELRHGKGIEMAKLERKLGVA